MASRFSFGGRAYDTEGVAAVSAGREDDANIQRRREYELQLAQEARRKRDEELDHQMRLYNFQKEQAIDHNAAESKIASDREAIAASNDLFKINTKDPDAHEKLADWGAKYFRQLDPKTGDPRLIKQFQVNTGRVETRLDMETKAKAITDAKRADLDAKAQALADKKAAIDQLTGGGKMAPTKATVDGVTYEAPKSADKTIAHERAAASADRQMQMLETSGDGGAAPKWLNSTGAMADKNGVVRWGFKDQPFDDKSPQASPDQIRRFERYNQLRKIYDTHTSKLDSLNMGEPVADEPAASPVAVTPPDVANLNLPTADSAPVSAVTPAPIAPLSAAAQPVAAPATPSVAPTAEPHPYEGKRVLQKSTGKYGSFKNGEFIPE